MTVFFSGKIFILLMLLSLFFREEAFSQTDFLTPSPVYNDQRLQRTVIVEAAVGTAIFVGLNYLWYKKFPHSAFHFFNDNGEWLNMDKAGHATTAYDIAVIQSGIMRWCGVKSGNAAWAGSTTALGFMTIIEIFDGFSSQWGFSPGDMIANMGGCFLFEGQQLLWNDQRISLKFSYHATIFPSYYPQELGSNFIERMFKDYNGQTYWLSGNIHSFLSSSSTFPKWLNIAAGYGADGMIGARNNPSQVDGQSIPEYKRYRQFHLSFDTDLYRINNLSPFGTTLLNVNRLLKMPAPTIEWNKVDGVREYLLYY